MDLNKVMLIGRLTRDPETRTTPQGTNVVSFGLATNLRWKGSDGSMQEKVEFHNIVAWRKLAEIIGQYLKKGKQVYIEGRLQTRSWEGKDGKKNYRTEVVADNLIMLGSRNEAQAEASAPTTKVAAKAEGADTDTKKDSKEEEINIEDIPF